MRLNNSISDVLVHKISFDNKFIEVLFFNKYYIAQKLLVTNIKVYETSKYFSSKF